MTLSGPCCEVLIDSEPRSGDDNMQRDAALLERVVDDGTMSFVRIYRWREPTVSLGHFQANQNEVDPRLQACPQVRRLSGGGAILHDQEWTYSCALPASHKFRHHPVQAYERVHSAVIELLQSLGVNARLRQALDASESLTAVNEPFLCFLRADPRDVVLSGAKILGSAQRRRRGAILQHGSILMRASSLTPEIPGICDLVVDFDEESFAAQLPAAVSNAVAESFRTVCL